METWKDAINYEGKYLVSSFGNVMSLSFRRTKHPKLLKQPVNTRGYLHVRLHESGKGQTIQVHRLVYESFHGQTDLLVLHKNGNPLDNRLENLYAGTQSQNQLDSVRHGTHRNVKDY